MKIERRRHTFCYWPSSFKLRHVSDKQSAINISTLFTQTERGHTERRTTLASANLKQTFRPLHSPVNIVPEQWNAASGGGSFPRRKQTTTRCTLLGVAGGRSRKICSQEYHTDLFPCCLPPLLNPDPRQAFHRWGTTRMTTRTPTECCKALVPGLEDINPCCCALGGDSSWWASNATALCVCGMQIVSHMFFFPFDSASALFPLKAPKIVIRQTNTQVEMTSEQAQRLLERIHGKLIILIYFSKIHRRDWKTYQGLFITTVCVLCADNGTKIQFSDGACWIDCIASKQTSNALHPSRRRHIELVLVKRDD